MTVGTTRNAAKTGCRCAALALFLFAASAAPADTVTYTLDDVVLDDNNAPMYGTFTWTYLAGSVHDDGVDITLFLVEPLTPTTASAIDLAQSAYDIGGNGFHTGLFLSGSVGPDLATDVGDLAASLETLTAASTNALTTSPNPFHPRTTVTYSVARPGPVRVSVLDVRGRRVAALVDRWQAAGVYSVPWDGSAFASGLYLVLYEANGESRMHKAVLMR